MLANKFFKKKFGIHLGLLALSLNSLSLHSENLPTVATEPQAISTQLELTQGYRHDRLQWSLSGRHKNPNILSELTFKSMHIYQSRLAAKAKWDGYFLTGQIGYGYLGAGRVQDSDYASDNRRHEFSRARARVVGSYTIDFKATFGKDFTFQNVIKDMPITLSPLVGVYWNEDKLRFKHGVETKLFGHNRHKKIHGLNSTYRSKWNAPLIGILAKIDLSPKINVYGEYDLLFAVRNSAHAYWNLRNDHHGMRMVMQSKRIKGFGHVGMVGVGYEICKNLTIKTEGQFSWIQARGGHALSHEHHMTLKQPFHRAAFMSGELRLLLGYSF